MSKRTHPSVLTDRIDAFRALFKAHRETGVRANAEGVAYLIGELDAIHALARELREEVSALRWNFEGRADRERQRVQATLANIRDPASNVVPLRRGVRRCHEAGTL